MKNRTAKKAVNFALLMTALNPLAGLADDDEAYEKYKHVNPNDESQVKAIQRELLVPYYAGLTEKKQAALKLCLQYFLSTRRADFGRIFDSNLPPFNAPDAPALFFVWLWEELFGDESYNLEDIGNYIIIDDMYAANF